MLTSLLRRVLYALPIMLGVALVCFALVHIAPGDPLVSILPPDASADLQAQLRELYGFNKPLPVQFAGWVWRALHGDLGLSTITHEPVFREFLTLFPATIELSMVALFLALAIGLPAGILAAMKRNTVYDYTVMGASLTGYSMPIFWWGLLLILFFSVTLGWTPVSGRIAIQFDIPPVTGFMLVDSLLSDDKGAFRSALSHLILPAVALGTIPLAVIARMTRSSMLEVLREDYVRTARAKGASTFRVVGIHALRNALIPVITTVGLQVGTLLAGAILTETIFSWPGIGKWLVEAIHRRDYPAVQGGILMSATVIIAVNLLVDLLYGVINPRIRHH